MRIVLDAITAFEYWRCATLTDAARPMRAARPQLTSFEGCSSKELSERIRSQEGGGGAMRVLVASAAERRDSEFVTCGVWQRDSTLPPDSVLQIGSGIYVESPEFCLLRLASTLPRLEFLRALSDILGIYGLSYLNRQDIVSREPLTTIEKIREFLNEVDGTRGANKLRRALNWVVERSASPRETSMNLELSMPTRLGGQNMPRFEANHHYDLTPGAKLLTQKKYLVGDVSWVDDDVEMEYNSNRYHDTEDHLEMDFEKITALECMDITVFPVSTRQYNDYAAFASIVEKVRKRLHVRHRTSDAIEERRRETHEELLRIERRQRDLPSLVETARWQFLMPRLETDP